LNGGVIDEPPEERTMFVQPIDFFLAVWFLLAFASTAEIRPSH
jgi:hypothetical protein